MLRSRVVKGLTRSKLVANSRPEPMSPESCNNVLSPTPGRVTLGNCISSHTRHFGSTVMYMMWFNPSPNSFREEVS